MDILQRLENIIASMSKTQLKTKKTLDSLLAGIKNECQIIHPDIEFIVSNHINQKIVIDKKIDLDRIILNLIHNAAQARKDARVEVHTFLNDGKLIMTIQDNGPGILQQQVSKIFDHGFSGKGSTGLGLYSAKQELEKLNATIELTSSSSPTTFKIQLPL